jgi:hypothetical protein
MSNDVKKLQDAVDHLTEMVMLLVQRVGFLEGRMNDLEKGGVHLAVLPIRAVGECVFCDGGLPVENPPCLDFQDNGGGYGVCAVCAHLQKCHKIGG